MKRHSIKDINLAKVITFDSGDFYQVKVDKNEKKVYRLRRCDNKEIQDITDVIIDSASKYTIGDIVIDAPYTMGVFLARVLDGCVNRKCINWLKVWDAVTID